MEEDEKSKQVDFTSRLYDPEKSKEENFEENRDYVLLKITKDNLYVEDPRRIFRDDTKYCTVSEDVFTNDVALDVLYMDTHEASAHAVYLKNFRKYKPTFGCEERVFFEALLVKHKSFGGKFSYSVVQTENELGIKRSTRETIIKKFTQLGIIETLTITMPGEHMKKITWFKVNISKVIELIPEIYNDKLVDLGEVERYFEQNYMDVKKSTIKL